MTVGLLAVGQLLAAPAGRPPSAEQRGTRGDSPDSCRRWLPRLSTRTPTAQRLVWSLAYTSPILPSLRVYKSRDRYPHAIRVDCSSGRKFVSFGRHELLEQLRAAKVSCTSVTVAKHVVQTLVWFALQPYSPHKLELVAQHRSNGSLVTAAYMRTTPWAPPRSRRRSSRAIAGSKLSRVRATYAVGSDCHVTIRSQREETLKTHP